MLKTFKLPNALKRGVAGGLYEFPRRCRIVRFFGSGADLVESGASNSPRALKQDCHHEGLFAVTQSVLTASRIGVVGVW